MLADCLRITKFMYRTQVLTGQNFTIGEVSKNLNIPYSTCKRRMKNLINSGLVATELVEYKSTGKHVFWLTEKGLDYVPQIREIF